MVVAPPDPSPWPPAWSWRALLGWLGGGGAGLIAFALCNRLVGPAIFGPVPEPIDIAMAILGTHSLAYVAALHLGLGIFVLPLIYVYLLRPLILRIVPDLPWWLIGALYGGMIWLVALAGVIFDAPRFWEYSAFTSIIWSALLGHIALGITLAAAVHFRER